jgi:hypothetical protein
MLGLKRWAAFDVDQSAICLRPWAKMAEKATDAPRGEPFWA